MVVKLVSDGGTREQIFICANVTKMSIPHEEGLIIELTPGPVLRIPEDGDVVYIMNDRGDTIDSYRYPKPEEGKADNGRDRDHEATLGR